MKEPKKINVQITGETKVLEIREGDALPLKEPLQITATGTISAPLTWLQENKTVAKKGNSYATVNRPAMKIVYEEDAKSSYGTTITGLMKVNPKIASYAINTNKLYGVKELVSLLRMNRLMFPDKEQWKKLLDNLMKFTASFKLEIEQKDNRKGETTDSLVSKLTTTIDLTFKLSEKLYVGSPDKTTFFVDVVPEVSDGGVKFWFESPELNEALEKEGEKTLDEQVKAIQGLGVTVLEIL